MDSDPKRVVIHGRVRTKDVKPYEHGGYRPPHPIVVHPPEGRGGSVPVSILQHHENGVGPVEKWMVEFAKGTLLHQPEELAHIDPGGWRIVAAGKIAAALQKILGADHE